MPRVSKSQLSSVRMTTKKRKRTTPPKSLTSVDKKTDVRQPPSLDTEVITSPLSNNDPKKQFRILRPSNIAKPRRLPNAWQLTRRTVLLLWQYRSLFLGIILIYGILDFLLVQGLNGNTNISSLKSQLSHSYHGNFGGLFSGLTIYTVLVGSAGNNSSGTAGVYQVFLIIIASLALIWTLRQVVAGIVPTIREAYYKAMFPLIPFILVLLVIGLQLVPLVLGTALYSTVISNSIASNGLEKFIFAFLALISALISFVMVSSSFVALYIVTLPDMTPIKALRSARNLVRYRRIQVLRKILFIIVLMLIGTALIMLPFIIVIAAISQWVFFLLSLVSLAIVHGYMYILYRELLIE